MGATVTISGSGFDTTTANDLVLVGNVLATIVTATSDGNSLTIRIPGGLSPGVVPILVATGGAISNQVNFTVVH